MIDDSLLIPVAVPIGLAMIMAMLGLSLVLDDFRRVVKMPRGVAIGKVNLALISPELTILAAVYASFMFFSAGLFAWFMGMRNRTA